MDSTSSTENIDSREATQRNAWSSEQDARDATRGDAKRNIDSSQALLGDTLDHLSTVSATSEEKTHNGNGSRDQNAHRRTRQTDTTAAIRSSLWTIAPEQLVVSESSGTVVRKRRRTAKTTPLDVELTQSASIGTMELLDTASTDAMTTTTIVQQASIVATSVASAGSSLENAAALAPATEPTSDNPSAAGDIYFIDPSSVYSKQVVAAKHAELRQEYSLCIEIGTDMLLYTKDWYSVQQFVADFKNKKKQKQALESEIVFGVVIHRLSSVPDFSLTAKELKRLCDPDAFVQSSLNSVFLQKLVESKGPAFASSVFVMPSIISEVLAQFVQERVYFPGTDVYDLSGIDKDTLQLIMSIMGKLPERGVCLCSFSTVDHFTFSLAVAYNADDASISFSLWDSHQHKPDRRKYWDTVFPIIFGYFSSLLSLVLGKTFSSSADVNVLPMIIQGKDHCSSYSLYILAEFIECLSGGKDTISAPRARRINVKEQREKCLNLLNTQEDSAIRTILHLFKDVYLKQTGMIKYAKADVSNRRTLVVKGKKPEPFISPVTLIRSYFELNKIKSKQQKAEGTHCDGADSVAKSAKTSSAQQVESSIQPPDISTDDFFSPDAVKTLANGPQQAAIEKEPDISASSSITTSRMPSDGRPLPTKTSVQPPEVVTGVGLSPLPAKALPIGPQEVAIVQETDPSSSSSKQLLAQVSGAQPLPATSSVQALHVAPDKFLSPNQDKLLEQGPQQAIIDKKPDASAQSSRSSLRNASAGQPVVSTVQPPLSAATASAISLPKDCEQQYDNYIKQLFEHSSAIRSIEQQLEMFDGSNDEEQQLLSRISQLKLDSATSARSIESLESIILSSDCDLLKGKATRNREQRLWHRKSKFEDFKSFKSWAAKNPLLTIRSTSDYQIMQKLDDVRGHVHLAKLNGSDTTVVVKQLSFTPTTTKTEIAVMLSADHPNIVKLNAIAVSNDIDQVWLEMEFCGQKTLRDWLGEVPSPSFAARKAALHQVFSAISYLHSKEIIHGDIKLDNILFDSAGTCKVIDFGVSESKGKQLLFYTRNTTLLNAQALGKIVGTYFYMAPELSAALHSDSPSDVRASTTTDAWSLGVVLAEVLFDVKCPVTNASIPQFQVEYLQESLHQIEESKRPFLDDAIDLVCRLLGVSRDFQTKERPELRLSALLALNHKFFASSQSCTSQGNDSVVSHNRDPEASSANAATAAIEPSDSSSVAPASTSIPTCPIVDADDYVDEDDDCQFVGEKKPAASKQTKKASKKESTPDPKDNPLILERKYGVNEHKLHEDSFKGAIAYNQCVTDTSLMFIMDALLEHPSLRTATDRVTQLDFGIATKLLNVARESENDKTFLNRVYVGYLNSLLNAIEKNDVVMLPSVQGFHFYQYSLIDFASNAYRVGICDSYNMYFGQDNEITRKLHQIHLDLRQVQAAQHQASSSEPFNKDWMKQVSVPTADVSKYLPKEVKSKHFTIIRVPEQPALSLHCGAALLVNTLVFIFGAFVHQKKVSEYLSQIREIRYEEKIFLYSRVFISACIFAHALHNETAQLDVKADEYMSSYKDSGIDVNIDHVKQYYESCKSLFQSGEYLEACLSLVNGTIILIKPTQQELPADVQKQIQSIAQSVFLQKQQQGETSLAPLVSAPSLPLQPLAEEQVVEMRNETSDSTSIASMQSSATSSGSEATTSDSPTFEPLILRQQVRDAFSSILHNVPVNYVLGGNVVTGVEPDLDFCLSVWQWLLASFLEPNLTKQVFMLNLDQTRQFSRYLSGREDSFSIPHLNLAEKSLLIFPFQTSEGTLIGVFVVEYTHSSTQHKIHFITFGEFSVVYVGITQIEIQQRFVQWLQDSYTQVFMLRAQELKDSQVPGRAHLKFSTVVSQVQLVSDSHVSPVFSFCGILLFVLHHSASTPLESVVSQLPIPRIQDLSICLAWIAFYVYISVAVAAIYHRNVPVLNKDNTIDSLLLQIEANKQQLIDDTLFQFHSLDDLKSALFQDMTAENSNVRSEFVRVLRSQILSVLSDTSNATLKSFAHLIRERESKLGQSVAHIGSDPFPADFSSNELGGFDVMETSENSAHELDLDTIRTVVSHCLTAGTVTMPHAVLTEASRLLSELELTHLTDQWLTVCHLNVTHSSLVEAALRRAFQEFGDLYEQENSGKPFLLSRYHVKLDEDILPVQTRSSRKHGKKIPAPSQSEALQMRERMIKHLVQKVTSLPNGKSISTRKLWANSSFKKFKSMREQIQMLFCLPSQVGEVKPKLGTLSEAELILDSQRFPNISCRMINNLRVKMFGMDKLTAKQEEDWLDEESAAEPETNLEERESISITSNMDRVLDDQQSSSSKLSSSSWFSKMLLRSTSLQASQLSQASVSSVAVAKVPLPKAVLYTATPRQFLPSVKCFQDMDEYEQPSNLVSFLLLHFWERISQRKLWLLVGTFPVTLHLDLREQMKAIFDEFREDSNCLDLIIPFFTYRGQAIVQFIKEKEGMACILYDPLGASANCNSLDCAIANLVKDEGVSCTFESYRNKLYGTHDPSEVELIMALPCIQFTHARVQNFWLRNPSALDLQNMFIPFLEHAKNYLDQFEHILKCDINSSCIWREQFASILALNEHADVPKIPEIFNTVVHEGKGIPKIEYKTPSKYRRPKLIDVMQPRVGWEVDLLLEESEALRRKIGSGVVKEITTVFLYGIKWKVAVLSSVSLLDPIILDLENPLSADCVTFKLQQEQESLFWPTELMTPSQSFLDTHEDVQRQIQHLNMIAIDSSGYDTDDEVRGEVYESLTQSTRPKSHATASDDLPSENESVDGEQVEDQEENGTEDGEQVEDEEEGGGKKKKKGKAKSASSSSSRGRRAASSIDASQIHEDSARPTTYKVSMNQDCLEGLTDPIYPFVDQHGAAVWKPYGETLISTLPYLMYTNPYFLKKWNSNALKMYGTFSQIAGNYELKSKLDRNPRFAHTQTIFATQRRSLHVKGKVINPKSQQAKYRDGCFDPAHNTEQEGRKHCKCFEEQCEKVPYRAIEYLYCADPACIEAYQDALESGEITSKTDYKGKEQFKHLCCAEMKLCYPGSSLKDSFVELYVRGWHAAGSQHTFEHFRKMGWFPQAQETFQRQRQQTTRQKPRDACGDIVKNVDDLLAGIQKNYRKKFEEFGCDEVLTKEGLEKSLLFNPDGRAVSNSKYYQQQKESNPDRLSDWDAFNQGVKNLYDDFSQKHNGKWNESVPFYVYHDANDLLNNLANLKHETRFQVLLFTKHLHTHGRKLAAVCCGLDGLFKLGDLKLIFLTSVDEDGHGLVLGISLSHTVDQKCVTNLLCTARKIVEQDNQGTWSPVIMTDSGAAERAGVQAAGLEQILCRWHFIKNLKDHMKGISNEFEYSSTLQHMILMMNAQTEDKYQHQHFQFRLFCQDDTRTEPLRKYFSYFESECHPKHENWTLQNRPGSVSIFYTNNITEALIRLLSTYVNDRVKQKNRLFQLICEWLKDQTRVRWDRKDTKTYRDAQKELVQGLQYLQQGKCRCHPEHKEDHIFLVQGSYDEEYMVDLKTLFCSCSKFLQHGRTCKHLYCALLYLAEKMDLPIKGTENPFLLQNTILAFLHGVTDIESIPAITGTKISFSSQAIRKFAQAASGRAKARNNSHTATLKQSLRRKATKKPFRQCFSDVFSSYFRGITEDDNAGDSDDEDEDFSVKHVTAIRESRLGSEFELDVFIQWKQANATTWEPIENAVNAPHVLARFHRNLSETVNAMKGSAQQPIIATGIRLYGSNASNRFAQIQTEKSRWVDAEYHHLSSINVLQQKLEQFIKISLSEEFIDVKSSEEEVTQDPDVMEEDGDVEEEFEPSTPRSQPGTPRSQPGTPRSQLGTPSSSKGSSHRKRKREEPSSSSERDDADAESEAQEASDTEPPKKKSKAPPSRKRKRLISRRTRDDDAESVTSTQSDHREGDSSDNDSSKPRAKRSKVIISSQDSNVDSGADTDDEASQPSTRGRGRGGRGQGRGCRRGRGRGRGG